MIITAINPHTMIIIDVKARRIDPADPAIIRTVPHPPVITTTPFRSAYAEIFAAL
ncbi:MAG: hypothetical protein A4E33_00699 [Methanoregula sp. PtaB.Bin085]|nr:MAG: hypothetical protein A4E33_00699 [Methanoregula sp. PtaB.Bin085]